jgi:dTDP-4-amino-4,6-dideoxygalactose transaminase
MEIKGLKVILKGKGKILQKIDEIVTTGMVAAGKNVLEVENKTSEYTSSKHAIAVSSGSSALLLIYKYLKDKCNVTRIGIPTNTFYATYRMAEIAGLEPFLLPCHGLQINLDASKEIILREGLGAVTIVHNGGFMDPGLPEYTKWCKNNGVKLVEDCAHSIGSELNNIHSGNFGFAGAISFFATKTLTGGEGGIVLTSNNSFAEWARMYRNYGKSKAWVTYHEMEGENLRMNEFSAAVISVQLDYLEEILNERKAIADIYINSIPQKYRLDLPQEQTKFSWYKFPVFKDIKEDLAHFRINISGGIYDLPLHKQPIISVEMEDETLEHICLPIYQGMTDNEKVYLLESLKQLFN